MLLQTKKWRKKFDTDSFNICADYVASSCATPDEIAFISGTYKHLTGVTINGIAEGLKVAGCGSVTWILQDEKKEDIEIIIKHVLHIPELPIRLICPQKVENKQDTLVMACIQKSMKLINFLEDSNSLQNIMPSVAFLSIILSTTFPNLRHTTWSFIKMSEKQII